MDNRYDERFEAMLAMLQRKQDAHLRRIGTLIERAKGVDLERARRRHDGLVDTLARSLLDVAVDTDDAEYARSLYSRIIESTCLPIRDNERQIREAVACGWEIIIGIDDVDHIARFTKGGAMMGRWQVIEEALQTLKGWILVTEAALDRRASGFDIARASRQLGHLSSGMMEKKYGRRTGEAGAREGSG